MPGHAFTVWFTGLSGAGKSSLAHALSAHLQLLSLPHEVLDGDELRSTLNRDLGFSKADRDENIRRIADLAGDLNKRNMSAIVAAISPYREARLRARRKCERFVEVFVDCSLATLIERDSKGLYASALRGEIQNFSGVSDPYEAPEHPEVYLNSGSQNEAACLERLLAALAERGYIPFHR